MSINEKNWKVVSLPVPNLEKDVVIELKSGSIKMNGQRPCSDVKRKQNLNKNRKMTLYIPIFNPSNKMTLVNANKIKCLKGHLPSDEIIVTHLLLQKAKVERDNNYKPCALILPVPLETFKEAKEKCPSLVDCIPLTGGGSGIPVCILVPEKEKENNTENEEKN